MNEVLITTLALIDGTSVGILFIQIWLLLQPEQVSVSRLLTYLTTIVSFYFVVGVAVMLGAASLAEPLVGTLDRITILYIQLAIGVGLFALAIYFWFKQQMDDPADRTDRWRTRVANRSSSTHSLI